MKKPHGGKRKRSGRKPLDDKKQLVPLYVLTSKINSIGGMDEIKKVCYDAIENKDK